MNDCGGDDELAIGPFADTGTASDNAGESNVELSIAAADTDAAEDMTGLVEDGCVKLGEEVAADIWSAVSTDDDVGIESAVVAPG